MVRKLILSSDILVHSHLLVFELPQEDFEKLETAANSHPPQRVVNPSNGWKLPFDVFDGQ
jgi:hypothetical protein